MQQKYRLFVDLDGVLVDFDSGVYRATGRWPGELSDREMWPILARTSGYYDKLGWMRDGKNLWDFVKGHEPVILTGVPLGKWAEPQKRSWCKRELGSDVPVVCCLSREKGKAAANEIEPGQIPVLVDDRLKSKQSWDDVGGLFILHTSAEESIAALRELGFA